jgi:hypothetical protein
MTERDLLIEAIRIIDTADGVAIPVVTITAWLERAKVAVAQPQVPPLSPSEVMALRDIVLAYLLWPTHTEVFVDVVHDVETTPVQLLERLMEMRP